MSSRVQSVVTVVGTRPEIIKLSRVMPVLDECVKHTIVHTGQNYDWELNGIFFEGLGLRAPDCFLNAAATTPAATIGNVISLSDQFFRETRPDALLVLGDTNSCMAAYAAKRLRIPIFHMEAGNRGFDERVPEEVNRRVVDHLSDINLPYSDRARENLLREGIAPDRVIKTGSPMFEVLKYYQPLIDKTDIMARLQLQPDGYFLMSLHREENIEPPQQFDRFVSLVKALVTEFDKTVILSTHPRTRKRIEQAGVIFGPRVAVMPPLGFPEYVKLQTQAYCVLTDSGSVSEESSILNFPALNLRETHERLEAMDEGAVMMVGLRPDDVLPAIELSRRQGRGDARRLAPVQDYAAPSVSEKVMRIIVSYTDYVRRNVWMEA